MSRIKITLLLFLALSVIAGPMPKSVHAQGGEEILGGLLRGLIESQLQRRERKNQEEQQRRRVDQQRRQNPQLPYPPQQPRPPQPRPQQPPRVVLTPEMQRGQQLSTNFNAEITRLTQLLNQDARRVPAVRPHLASVMKLQAEAAVLSARFNNPPDRTILIEQGRQLDREWRLVAHQLRQVRGIGQPCLQSIQRIDTIDQQFCDLYGMQPQIDRRELIRWTDALASSLDHLVEDVSVELGHRQNNLQIAGRRLQSRANILANSVTQGAVYDSIVAEYQEFRRAWTPYAATLERFNNRYIDRHVRRVHDTTRHLHELLWLPAELDREHVRHVATRMTQELTELYSHLDLNALIAIPNGNAAVPLASELYGTTEHLSDCLTRNESHEALLEDWQYVEEAWGKFSQLMQPCQDAKIVSHLRQFETGLAELRDSLGVQVVFDPRSAVQLASNLDSLLGQVIFHTKRWNSRPGIKRNTRLVERIGRLQKLADHMHHEVERYGDQEHMLNDFNQIFPVWGEVQQQLLQCSTPDRAPLERLCDQVTMTLVEIQTQCNSGRQAGPGPRGRF